MMGVILQGAQYKSDGLYYKVGRHGQIYRWNGEDWMNSTKTLEYLGNTRNGSRRVAG